MLFSSQLSNQRRSRLGGWLVRLSAGLSAAIAGVVLSALLHTPVVAQTSPQAGGATTIQNRSSQAYTQPAPNLNDFWNERHAAGDLAFEAAFVTPLPMSMRGWGRCLTAIPASVAISTMGADCQKKASELYG